MDFLMSILGNLIASQIYDVLPKTAAWLIARASGRLAIKKRDRYSEEWSAHLENCEGNLAKFFHGVGCARASFVMQPLSARMESYLLHFLNEHFNMFFVVISPKRHIPSHHPKTISENILYFKDIVRVEIPYIIVRRFAIVMCPDMVYSLDAFNHKWIFKTFLEPVGYTIEPPSHLLPYWDEIEMHEETAEN